MSHYDTWKTTCPEDEGPAPQACPVCTGDREASPCSEECDEILTKSKAAAQVRGAVKAAGDAIVLALEYVKEGDRDTVRLADALHAAQAWTKYARDLALILRETKLSALADTIPAPAEEAAE